MILECMIYYKDSSIPNLDYEALGIAEPDSKEAERSAIDLDNVEVINVASNPDETTVRMVSGEAFPVKMRFDDFLKIWKEHKVQ